MATSGTNNTEYPNSVKVFSILLSAVVFPAHGPPVITIFIILFSIFFSSILNNSSIEILNKVLIFLNISIVGLAFPF